MARKEMKDTRGLQSSYSVTVPSVFYILKANSHRKSKRGVVVCLAVLSELSGTQVRHHQNRKAKSPGDGREGGMADGYNVHFFQRLGTSTSAGRVQLIALDASARNALTWELCLYQPDSLTKLHVPLAGARSTFPSLSKRLNPFTDFYNLPLQVVHQASQVAVPPYSVATRSQGPINSLGG
ncbi:hypothetical protein FOIG_01340 [Fusarium odoratissimum NRRL 54006]|uniref:Uncharacterized protein n=1 Tax=Fusarium odoratissimum (strain NRRL 54006) TaxID=1089451 RepID=X0LTI3_FUSO5|nr:uncharacterized protein FOIG_01340 [Fusarium odoratissimum NRRL 54006]EXM11830.1 hypothetical protein FOIG_01340 [Fusarium odoratissimum NRRL 54006]